MKITFSKKSIGSLPHYFKSKSSQFRVSLIVIASLGFLGAFPFFTDQV
jgi:hypothetical protein